MRKNTSSYALKAARNAENPEGRQLKNQLMLPRINEKPLKEQDNG